jgi:hypothetical protein
MVTETELAGRLGVDRATLRGLRRGLVKRLDWDQLGNVVAYSPAGVEKIAVALAGRLGGGETPAEVDAGRGETPAGHGAAVAAELLRAEPKRRLVACVVVRVPRVTRHRLLVRGAQPEVMGEDFVVRVRENVHFIPGMTVQCLVSGSTGTVHGRLPRRKGRW